MLRLHVLASGSKGNAAIVEDRESGCGLLVDCGVTKRDFLGRCASVGFDARRIAGILVTHDHSDHVKGLGVVLRGLARLGAVPTVHADPRLIGGCAPLRQAVESVEGHLIPLEAMDGRARIGGIRVRAFATSHDALSSCGFRFECEADGDSLGYLTDTGEPTAGARDALAGCRILAIEANHDPDLLANGPYPYPVRQRIASRLGHLSNGQGAELLAELAWAGLEQVAAMHLSETNNERALAQRAFEQALAATAATRAQVACASQSRPITLG